MGYTIPTRHRDELKSTASVYDLSDTLSLKPQDLYAFCGVESGGAHLLVVLVVGDLYSLMEESPATRTTSAVLLNIVGCSGETEGQPLLVVVVVMVSDLGGRLILD